MIWTYKSIHCTPLGGGATIASQNHIDPAVIKTHGRWQSEAYLLYADIDQDNAGLQITDFLISRASWPCTYEEDNQKQIQKVWIKKQMQRSGKIFSKICNDNQLTVDQKVNEWLKYEHFWSQRTPKELIGINSKKLQKTILVILKS